VRRTLVFHALSPTAQTHVSFREGREGAQSVAHLTQ
jgi:hypothetical protein